MFSWKNLLKMLASAAVGGAITAGSAVAVDAGDLKGSLAKLGTVALAGAVTAVVHLFVQPPVAK